MKINTKKILASMSVFAILFTTNFFNPLQASDGSYVNVPGLNMRTAGHHKAKIVKVLSKGDFLSVEEELSNGWKKVVTQEGVVGFVNGKFLTHELPYYEKATASMYEVKVHSAFVRGENRKSIVAVLRSGDTLEILDEKLYGDLWFKVRIAQSNYNEKYNSREGYISKHIVQPVEGYEVYQTTSSDMGISSTQSQTNFNMNVSNNTQAEDVADESILEESHIESNEEEVESSEDSMEDLLKGLFE